ncbi:MAG: IS110 family transposase [Sulfurospirillum sp.]|nr:IS110 family transposase [Sulfurospirillum sp.]MBL0703750.1 IS110 family transposase [Sulfurospirillum sp.]
MGINNQSLEKILISKIKQLKFLQLQLDEFNEIIEQFVDEHHNDDIKLLTSISGTGKASAASFLIELGDINNFATHKQLTAFIGTDPTIYQSGTSVNIRGSISKSGNSHLRRSIWHMAEQVQFGTLYSKLIMIKNEVKARPLSNQLLRLPTNSFVLFFLC